MLVWELLRNFDQIDRTVPALSGPLQLFIFILTWVVQALFYGLLFIAIEHWLYGRVAFSRLIAAALTFQFITAILIVITIFFTIGLISIDGIPTDFRQFIQLPVIPIALIYAMIVNFCISLLIEINAMLGRGNLMRIIKGEFYKPKVGDRIFMFIDLRNSTAIAERLGHIKYSQLIQDCFHDLSVIHNYKAEIYQYVGDEAVLIWPSEFGLYNVNCIQAFFAFRSALSNKASYYNNKYNLLPEFKAGLNIGSITMAEVGNLKKEIAYHGDTINTAARIQGECNRLNADLLVSSQLLSQLNLTAPFKSTLKGQVQLKGKISTTDIYAIEQLD